MAQMIVRYREGSQYRWAVVLREAPSSASDAIQVRVINTTAATTAQILADLDRPGGRENLADGETVTLRAGDLVSPITADGSLLCQGLNYAEHAAEAQQAARKQNLFFAKASSSICGSYDEIVRPPEVELLDYEVEFGVVLRSGVSAKATVTNDNVGDFVAGVVLANDVSARDVMFGASFLQWFQGKSYRTFCPLGPVLYLLNRDEIAEALVNLEIKLWVNGELRQSAKSSQLIFKPAETIEQMSQVVDLKPGDVILTGTPGGVTAPATPKLVEILKTHLLADGPRRDAIRAEMSSGRPFLQEGDVVTASIRDLRSDRNLGGLQNRIVAH